MNPVKTMYSITFTSGAMSSTSTSSRRLPLHMVRNIAGGLVDLGLHRLTPDRFREILEGGDRTQLGRRHQPRACAWKKFFTKNGN